MPESRNFFQARVIFSFKFLSYKFKNKCPAHERHGAVQIETNHTYFYTKNSFETGYKIRKKKITKEYI